MGTKKKATKTETETGKGEVTAQNIKDIIGSLNKFLKAKKLPLCTIGKNKTSGMTNFEKMIDSLDEAISGKLPEKIIDFYNDNFGEEEEEEKTEEKPAKKDKKADKKADKKDKPEKKEKVKKVSNEGLAKQMLEDDASEKDIMAAFVKRYKERGQTDKEYIEKRVAIYIHIGKKALGIESTPPGSKAKKADKKADKPADKKADKKADKPADKKAKKKADKPADEKADKKPSKKKKKDKK